MMSRFSALAAAVALAFAAFGAPRAASAAPPEVKKSARGMTYTMRLPAGYDKAKGAVLVVAFHGQGGNHSNFFQAVEGMPAFRHAILAAPDAPAGAAWQEPDLGVAADLAAELQREWRPLRTIAFGFSRGAYFAFGLGLRHPDRFQAAVPHSGGLTFLPPTDDAAKRQAFYVIHGDADGVVLVSQSRDAVESLRAAGLTRVEYDEVKGLPHTVDSKAVDRAFAWIDKTLGPPGAPAFTDAEAKGRVDALEQALKANAWDDAAAKFGDVAGAPKRWNAKIAALAKAQVKSTHAPLAQAAIAAAGCLGEDGIAVLKTVPPDDEALAVAAAKALGRTGADAAAGPLLALLKAKPEPVAVAAANALGDLGGDPAISALIKGLDAAEGPDVKAACREAAKDALTKLTGQTFATAKEWKRWASQRK